MYNNVCQQNLTQFMEDVICKKILPCRMIIIALGVLVQMIVFIPESSGSNIAQGKIVLAADLSSLEHQEVFSGHDTIYALVTLTGFDPGEYAANINWINPEGNINQNTSLSLTIQPHSPFAFYSWLRLMKNGPFERELTGKQFDNEYLGRWELYIYINNRILKKAVFEIR